MADLSTHSSKFLKDWAEICQTDSYYDVGIRLVPKGVK